MAQNVRNMFVDHWNRMYFLVTFSNSRELLKNTFYSDDPQTCFQHSAP